MNLTIEDIMQTAENTPGVVAKFADSLGLTIGMLIEDISAGEIKKSDFNEFCDQYKRVEVLPKTLMGFPVVIDKTAKAEVETPIELGEYK